MMLFSRCLIKPVDSTHDCGISVCGFKKKEIIGIPEQPFLFPKKLQHVSAHECVLDLHNNHY